MSINSYLITPFEVNDMLMNITCVLEKGPLKHRKVTGFSKVNRKVMSKPENNFR